MDSLCSRIPLLPVSLSTLQHACLHAAMLSWRHPEGVWDPAAVAALAGQKQGSPSQRLWVQRRQNWGSALTSLYHGLRHQRASGPLTHCGAFYIIQAVSCV